MHPSSEGLEASARSIPARSLKTVAATAVFSGVGVVVAIVLLVLVIANRQRQAMDEVVRDIQTLDAVERLEGNLLYYVQTSNIYVVEPAPGTATMRDQMRTRIEEIETSLEALSGSQAERAAAVRTREAIATYFAEREAVEIESRRIRQIIAETSPALNGALASIAELRQINRRQLASSNERDLMLRRLTTLAGAGAVILVLAGVLGLVVFLRRQLIRPLVGLTRAASAFRAGDLEARAPEEGPLEVRDVARALNEAGSALADQRRTRLTFVASVAHDLRTPLQALKTSVELLRQEPDFAERPRVATVVDRIDRQSERLLLMANDLGDASQIEAGELKLSAQPTDLRDPVRAMVELYEPTSDSHAIELSLPDEPLMVFGDGVRLEQVAGNLLSNAIKYSPDGGSVRVAVEARETEVGFSVADEGVGIDPDTVAELFVPFRRGKRSTHLLAGSGLGLSVSKRIVSAHGGNITVEPRAEGGTTFVVTLPRLFEVAPSEHEEPGLESCSRRGAGLDDHGDTTVS